MCQVVVTYLFAVVVIIIILGRDDILIRKFLCFIVIGSCMVTNLWNVLTENVAQSNFEKRCLVFSLPFEV
jgi:hypothetical protein